MLGGLRSAFYPAKDLTAAKAWYTELLGYSPYFDEDFYVGFDVAGYELGLVPSGEGVEAAWAVHDLDAAIAKASDSGATVIEEPRDVGDGIQVAAIADPFGNRIGIIRNPHFAPAIVHTAAADRSERMIVVEKTIPADPRSAWNLWASDEGLAQWWTNETKVDMRPGGSYEIYFNPDEPPGDRGADWCRVLSFLPGRMLSFTWNAPPDLATRPRHTWVVITFEPVAGGTSVTLNHLGWPDSGLAQLGSDWPATFQYFESAWVHVMSLFEAHFDGAA